jgi:hypothetical protein
MSDKPGHGRRHHGGRECNAGLPELAARRQRIEFLKP